MNLAPPERPLRVVVDTSTALPILLLRHPPPHWLSQLWSDRTITLLATNETLAELREKLIEHSPVTGDNQVRLFLRRTLGCKGRRDVVPLRRGKTVPPGRCLIAVT